MHSAPIYFLSITYTVKRYFMRNKKLELQHSTVFHTSDEVCIGNTVDVLNNEYWNRNLLNRLKKNHQSKNGIELEVYAVHKELSSNGYTTERFEREFPA